MRWSGKEIGKMIVAFGLAASLCTPSTASAKPSEEPAFNLNTISTSFAAQKTNKDFSAHQLARLIDKAPEGTDMYLGDQHDITANAEIIFSHPVMKALQRKKVPALAIEVPIEFQPIIDDLKRNPHHLDQAIKKFLYTGVFMNDNHNFQDRIQRATCTMEGVLLAQKYGIAVQATDTRLQDMKKNFQQKLLEQNLTKEQSEVICTAMTTSFDWERARISEACRPDFFLNESALDIAQQTDAASKKHQQPAIKAFNELFPGSSANVALEQINPLFTETRMQTDINRFHCLSALRQKGKPLAVYYGGDHCDASLPASMAYITKQRGIPLFSIQLVPYLSTECTTMKRGADGTISYQKETISIQCKTDGCFDVYTGGSVLPTKTSQNGFPRPQNS